MLPEMTLMHVELRIPTKELLDAQPPAFPIGALKNQATLADWDERATAAKSASERLMNRYVNHALRCIIGSPELMRVTLECGDAAILRLSLERPPNGPA